MIGYFIACYSRSGEYLGFIPGTKCEKLDYALTLRERYRALEHRFAYHVVTFKNGKVVQHGK